MKKYSVCLCLLAFLWTLGTAPAVLSIEILPTSYVFDKATDTGSYSYHDWTGVQLIDGQYGTAPWTADLGNGNAYEWVGWVSDTPVNIDFDFGAATQIDTIHIGTVQDHVNDVVVPSFDLFSSSDGSAWTLMASLSVPESGLNDDTYFTFAFDSLGIDAQYVRVSLTHSLNGPWTFVDEVDFYDTPVPEPATMVLLGVGLIGLAGVRRNTA